MKKYLTIESLFLFSIVIFSPCLMSQSEDNDLLVSSADQGKPQAVALEACLNQKPDSQCEFQVNRQLYIGVCQLTGDQQYFTCIVTEQELLPVPNLD